MSSPNRAATSGVSATQPTHAKRHDVVQGGAPVGLDADVLAERGRDAPGPQHVVHRLAEAEVGGEREGADEVGQPDA